MRIEKYAFALLGLTIVLMFTLAIFRECKGIDPTKAVYKEVIQRTDSTVVYRVWKYEVRELGTDTVRYEYRRSDNTLEEHNGPRMYLHQNGVLSPLSVSPGGIGLPM